MWCLIMINGINSQIIWKISRIPCEIPLKLVTFARLNFFSDSFFNGDLSFQILVWSSWLKIECLNGDVGSILVWTMPLKLLRSNNIQKLKVRLIPLNSNQTSSILFMISFVNANSRTRMIQTTKRLCILC